MSEELSKIAREKKRAFLLARSNNEDFDTLKIIGEEYIDAIAVWHKNRFPNKRFTKPSIGYLIRAL